MPSFKATRLQHIQDILAGRKKALLQREVPARHMPKWPELSVKIIYPQMLAAHPDLAQYLPDPQGRADIRLPERDFFYRVAYALHPSTVEDLVTQAADARKPKAADLQEEQWTLKVKDEWMDRLLQYDYVSCKLLFLPLFDKSLIPFPCRQEGPRPQQPPDLQGRARESQAPEVQRRRRRAARSESPSAEGQPRTEGRGPDGGRPRPSWQLVLRAGEHHARDGA